MPIASATAGVAMETPKPPASIRLGECLTKASQLNPARSRNSASARSSVESTVPGKVSRRLARESRSGQKAPATGPSQPGILGLRFTPGCRRLTSCTSCATRAERRFAGPRRHCRSLSRSCSRGAIRRCCSRQWPISKRTSFVSDPTGTSRPAGVLFGSVASAMAHFATLLDSGCASAASRRFSRSDPACQRRLARIFDGRARGRSNCGSPRVDHRDFARRRGRARRSRR